jgi:hypothetical protein
MGSYSPHVIALVCLGLISASTWMGMQVRKRVPESHLASDGKDIVKVGLGFLATMTALVIGLLVGSAKSSFDTIGDGVVDSAAAIVRLDRMLEQYGPETAPLREQMRQSLKLSIGRIWSEQASEVAGLAAIANQRNADQIEAQLLALQPANEAQAWYRDESLGLFSEFAQLRAKLIQQERVELPRPLVGILLGWLCVLFAGFGLLAPRNPTVLLVLTTCGVSASCAVLVILDMSQPLVGWLRVSSAPLVDALARLGG